MATREFIKVAKGVPLEESRRLVDEHLVDGNGQALLEAGSEEARMLRDLYQQGGKGTITGNKDRSMMRQLELARLISHSIPALDTVEYEITGLGRTAVEQLL